MPAGNGDTKLSKRQQHKRKDREYVAHYDDFEAKARDCVHDVVKTDEAARQKFIGLMENLDEIQEEHLKYKGGACVAATLRSVNMTAKVSQIAVKRSKNLAKGDSAFSTNDFIKNLLSRFPRDGADEDADSPSLDFKKNAQIAVEYFATTPTALCLANQLSKSFEPKARKAAVRQQKRDVLEVRPLINVEGTAKDSRNTQKRQQQLFKRVYEEPGNGEVRLAELILDPTSFGETCENLFACSFLIEKNDLALSLDANGCFVARKVILEDAGADETEGVVRDILKFDWDTYEQLCNELYPKGTADTMPYFKFNPSLPEDPEYNKQLKVIEPT